MDFAENIDQNASDYAKEQSIEKNQEIEELTGVQETNIKMLPTQERLKLYYEIQNSCVQQSIEDAKKLKITTYMKETLNLSIEEINENIRLRKSSMFENFLIYRDLIIALSYHEMNQKDWHKDLSSFAYEILSIYVKSKDLNDNDILNARWSAFAEVYEFDKINLNIFTDLLERISDQTNKEEKEVITCMSLGKKKNKIGFATNGEINTVFWRSSAKLFHKFASIFAENFMNIKDDFGNIMVKFHEMIDIVLQVEEFAKKQNHEIIFEINLKVEVAGLASKQLNHCVNKDIIKECYDDAEFCLNVLTGAVKFIASHFQEVYKQNFEIFQRLSEYSFAKDLYSIYDEKLTETIKPIVEDITKKLKQESQVTVIIAAMLLYEELRKFTQIGIENFEKCDLQLLSYENWFPTQLVTIIKTPERISKAIASENDDSSKDYEYYKRTSSAVDSMELICTFKKFWHQFEYEEKRRDEVLQFIVSEMCRLTLDYVDKYMMKIDNDENESENDIYYSRPIKMSIAVANFQYVLEELQGLLSKNPQEFNFFNSEVIKEIFKNTFKTIEEKMTETIEISMEKFTPTFQKWIMEAAANENDKEKLFTNVYDLFKILEENLKQKRFEAAKQYLWKRIIKNLGEILNDAISDAEPQEFFANLKEIWSNLKQIFDLPIDDNELKTVANFEESIEWYCMESSDLFYRQYEHQSKNISNTAASATINCSIVKNKLLIEILHARNLNSLVPESNCHTFIKLKPIHREFNSIPSVQTKVMENTHFPLFEETFEFDLTEEKKNCQDAAVYFKLKRKHPYGTVSTLGEAFISFREIPIITEENQKPLRKEIPFLKLSEDEYDDVKTMTVLKYRKKSNDEATKKIFFDIRCRDKSPSVELMKIQMTNAIKTSIRRGSKLIPKFIPNMQ